MEYHDDVEEAQEATTNSENTTEKDKHDGEKLLDIENEPKDMLIRLDTTNSSKNGIVCDSDDMDNEKSLEEFFGNLILEEEVSNSTKQSVNRTEGHYSEFDKSSEEQKLAMDIFGENTNFDPANLSSLPSEAQQQQSLNLLASESVALLDEILNDKQCASNSDWESISNDTFLPPNILKQSLGDATLGVGQKNTTNVNSDDKVSVQPINKP